MKNETIIKLFILGTYKCSNLGVNISYYMREQHKWSHKEYLKYEEIYHDWVIENSKI